MSLLRMAGDAVEKGSQEASGCQAHVFDGLVTEQFEQDELVSSQNQEQMLSLT